MALGGEHTASNRPDQPPPTSLDKLHFHSSAVAVRPPVFDGSAALLAHSALRVHVTHSASGPP